MKRIIFLVSAVLFAAPFSAMALAAPAAAQGSNCEFVLGFKTLHGAIPTIVGNCVENEHYAANGDGLQRTTNGLLVWRKADNHAAFTDGYRTWVNGPLGVQERLNTQRFDWEKDATVFRTEVITFTPPNTAIQQASGSCFSWSLAATRTDAYRCFVGNEIFDPCFTVPENSSSLICVRDPRDSSTFLQLNLTKPLPTANPANLQTHPWFLELADGSVCNYFTGATGGINGERLNYGCSDGWDIVGLPTSDTVWTVQEVLLAPRSLNVVKTATVGVMTAWQ